MQLALPALLQTALENNDRRPQLTPADYRRIAHECLELGAIHLSLQGGEAPLMPNLEELIRAMSPPARSSPSRPTARRSPLLADACDPGASI
jgi:hypothetical protein